MNPTPGPLLVVDGYGLQDAPADGSVLPWATVADWLVRARNYWVTSVGANSRPHAMPVWGLWLDDALWFSTDPESVKGRNLRRSPETVVHLESGDEVCVLEGAVEWRTAAALPDGFAGAYEAKYDFAMDVTNPSYAFLRLAPRVALTWRESDFPSSATRWRFS